MLCKIACRKLIELNRSLKQKYYSITNSEIHLNDFQLKLVSIKTRQSQRNVGDRGNGFGLPCNWYHHK